jgi:hypothetical protein
MSDKHDAPRAERFGAELISDDVTALSQDAGHYLRDIEHTAGLTPEESGGRTAQLASSGQTNG